MRIPNANITTTIFFEARDASDYVTPESGLAGKMIAKIWRNGGSPTAMTTPTIAEVDTGSAGYTLLMDEMTTMDAGYATQELRVRVTDTGGHMAPAIRVIELFRDSVISIDTGPLGDVNAQVVDALNVDTYAEPGLGAPAATTTLVEKIGYLYKAWRNKATQDTGSYDLYSDDEVTVDQAANTLDDGTTFTRGEVGSG